MKFSIINKFFLLFFITSSLQLIADSHKETNLSTDISASQPVQTIDQEETEIENNREAIEEEQFEKLVENILGQIKKVGSILQVLADQISNHQITLKNKQEVLQHIMLLKEQINNIERQTGSLVDHDLEKITTILSIVTLFSDHIHELLKNNLTQIPQLSFDTLIKRGKEKKECSFATISQTYKDNAQLLENLEKESNTIGLTRFNRAFRWLENVNENYNIIPSIKKLAVCGLALSTITLLVDESILAKIPGYRYLIKPIKNKVGDAPRFNKSGNLKTTVCMGLDQEGYKVHKPLNLSLLGRVLANFGPHGLNLITYVFTPIITWELIGGYLKNDAIKARNTFDDLSTKILNWLRGGAARAKMRGGKKEPSVTFKDGIGFDHIKYALYPYIEYYCRTEGWDRANIAPQTGIIFAGESRTGKTFMAEMLAGQIKQEMRARGIGQDLTFIVFNAAEVQLLGIGNILEYARSQAPCIIFIDEIDMLGLQRETNAQVLSEFLTQMSGCMEKDINKRVILIGATNKPESLDRALLQYGRFGKVIWFEYPTAQERMLFLAKECHSRAIFVDQAFLEKLACETERCSYDALHNIIATAAQKARMEESAVKQHHIEAAFDEEIHQMLIKTTQLPAHQQHTIATHLAGHALATHLLKGQKNLVKVTIRPIKNQIQEQPFWTRFQAIKQEKVDPIIHGKVFTYNKDQEFSMPSYDDMINECKIMLAGHATEKIITGSCGYGYHQDDQKQALCIAKHIVFKGMSPEELPKATRAHLEEKALTLLEQCEREITQLLTDNKEQLVIIAEALEKQQTLSGEEVAMLSTLTADEIATLRIEIKKLEEQLLKDFQEQSKTTETDNNRDTTEVQTT